MRYYSDITEKFYESEKDCKKAEDLFQKEKAEKEAKALQLSTARKEDAKKVEDAYQHYIDARKEYHNQLSEFCKRYGSYHVTVDKNGLLDWMDSFWENWF